MLREVGDVSAASRDLQEAMEASTHYGFPLHEAEAHLLQGHLALDNAPPAIEDAQAALKRAKELVAETAYHRRDADTLILEGRLAGRRGDRAAGRAKLAEAIRAARREEEQGAVYQLAVDQAERYLKELA